MTVTVNGLKLNYEICGQGNDILFLHGWGSSIDAFRRMMDPLSKSFRCIALDLPGFGKSDMPNNPLTLEDYCAFVKGFMEELGVVDPIMIGHSNGGRITLNMCASAMVNPKKIVLFGSAGLRSKKTFKQKFRQATFKAIKRVLSLPLIKNFTADLMNAARNHFGSADYNSAPPVMRQTLVNLINTDLYDKLPNVSASTLLIWGECDTATPLWMAKVMEERIPDCGLCELKGLTHWCFIEDPYKVDSILQSFLGGNK